MLQEGGEVEFGGDRLDGLPAEPGPGVLGDHQTSLFETLPVNAGSVGGITIKGPPLGRLYSFPQDFLDFF